MIDERLWPFDKLNNHVKQTKIIWIWLDVRIEYYITVLEIEHDDDALPIQSPPPVITSTPINNVPFK